MKEVHFYVLGRVQGVGYRAWCTRQANAYGLSGWVRNRSDGSVEIRVKGKSEVIDMFLTECHKGPLWARVTALKPVSFPNAVIPEIEDNIFIQKPTV